MGAMCPGLGGGARFDDRHKSEIRSTWWSPVSCASRDIKNSYTSLSVPLASAFDSKPPRGTMSDQAQLMMSPFGILETEVTRDSKGPAFRSIRFGDIKRTHGLVWPLRSDEVSLPAILVRDLLRFALERVRFDERYYLRNYPDVAEALANGLFADAHHHYVEFGYFEDRLPFRVEVDTAFYYREYPDVEAEVDAGTILSAQDHFEHHGYKEGRLPRADWSLLAG
jgi:hypothetical protein